MKCNMEKKLLLIGASGHGKVIADIAIKSGYTILGFLDDNPEIEEVMGFPVIGKVSDAVDYIEKAQMCVSIGNPQVRSRIMSELVERGAVFPNLIHPNAVIGMNVSIGEGTVVMAGAVINPDTMIGKGCIINTCASVDHDCIIEDYAHISVGAHVAGTVRVGKGSWIGVGAAVKNNIFICSDCMIGAGAVVVKDIVVGSTYVGVPAEELV